MSNQLSHKEHHSPGLKFPVVLLTDNLMGDANIGSLFRLADAFNIEKLVFCGTPINLNSNRLKKTARATYKTVAYEEWEDPVAAIRKYRQDGYISYGLEITNDSTQIDSIDFSNKEKIILIVGNERHGISPRLLDEVENKVHIRMFGHNSSMNVSQATGIAFYEITKTLPPLREK
ncbi:TrmH family RNA methyltransferase [Antarcticibacterium flavum]|uniref:TrmH family RNA methyltransferase n=1 Tax=Antarcticibacterium flavum TaxID=2058175 RepID=A0A5B7X0G9_9FLAO|nr:MULTISPECIES: TrmH family RNA methyltransferase [Antarcticibacterium]MCM4158837.1 RNA methyltransferase [Antarcticibacterium sp. W02-3]QCY68101.1 TrmH family RNA methyltransferase [Antarcticibacterium flavum]